MASCGEDRSGEYYALIGENVWIEQIMKEHYLWYDSIPAIKETDYFAEPEDFLQKLVYTKAQNGKGVFVYRNKGRFRCGTFLPATYFYLRI